MSDSLQTPEDTLDIKFLESNAISLPAEAVAWAARLSQSTSQSDGSHPERSWSMYQQLLAVLGLQHWLQWRSPHLPLKSTWIQWDGENLPTLQSLPDALQNWILTLGQTTVQLLPYSCIEDGFVDVPGGAIAFSDHPPDYTLLVEVLEELEHIQVKGFIPYSELLSSIHKVDVHPDVDQFYTVPLNWFDTDLNHFLLQVHYQNARSVTPLIRYEDVQVILSAWAQPVINVATWWKNELDAMAQQLNWLLLPSFSYSPEMRAMRSPVDQLDPIVCDLTRHQNVTIPREARSASYGFHIGDTALCLYVVTWELPTPGETSDWMLLAILSAEGDGPLPPGIGLQIWDAHTRLSETLLPVEGGSFLYSQVVGVAQESFVIAVRSPNGMVMAMPPITFAPLD